MLVKVQGILMLYKRHKLYTNKPINKRRWRWRSVPYEIPQYSYSSLIVAWWQSCNWYFSYGFGLNHDNIEENNAIQIAKFYVTNDAGIKKNY